MGLYGRNRHQFGSNGLWPQRQIMIHAKTDVKRNTRSLNCQLSRTLLLQRFWTLSWIRNLILAKTMIQFLVLYDSLNKSVITPDQSTVKKNFKMVFTLLFMVFTLPFRLTFPSPAFYSTRLIHKSWLGQTNRAPRGGRGVTVEMESLCPLKGDEKWSLPLRVIEQCFTRENSYLTLFKPL